MIIRFINWWLDEKEKDKNDNYREKSLYAKVITPNNEKLFIRFDLFNYYLSEEKKNPRDDLLYSNEFSIKYARNTSYGEATSLELPIEKKKLSLFRTLDKYHNYYNLLKNFVFFNWFFLVNNIDPSGTYEVDLIHKSLKVYEIKKIIKKIDNVSIKRSYIALDIECFTTGLFPLASDNAHPITHISLYILTSNNLEFSIKLLSIEKIPNFETEILKLPKSDYTILEDIKVQSLSTLNKYVFGTEEIIIAFTEKLLSSKEFDVCLSYNGHKFDFNYMNMRSYILRGRKLKFINPTNELEDINFNTIYSKSQASNHEVTNIDTNSGLIFFDMYNFARKDIVHSSYKLNEIAKLNFTFKARVDFSEEKIHIIFNKTELSRSLSFLMGALKFSACCEINDKIYQIESINYSDDFIILNCENLVRVLKFGEIVEVSFGKDDIMLIEEYRNYNLKSALKMADYCLNDAYLCKALFDKYGLSDRIDSFSTTALIPQDKVLTYRASTIIKGPLLKLMLEEKIILINTISEKPEFKGAKVFEPTKQIVKNNVLIMDYSSLYPSICIFGNLSPETMILIIKCESLLDYELNYNILKKMYPFPDFLVTDYKPVSSEIIYTILVVYSRKEEGIVPKLLKTFLKNRKMYKGLMKEEGISLLDYNIFDSMQYVNKILANSIYGLMGFQNSIIYSQISGATCTSIGRKMIMYLHNLLNRSTIYNSNLYLIETPKNIFSGEILFYDVIPLNIDNTIKIKLMIIYGDTDSIFIELENVTDLVLTSKIGLQLEKIINENFLFETFKIEFEAIYVNLLFQAKKKYNALKYPPICRSAKEKYTVLDKGTSFVRRDVCMFHKKFLNTFRNIVCDRSKLNSSNVENIQLEIINTINTVINCEEPNIHEFILTRAYKKEYKSEDNLLPKIVNEYNKSTSQKIMVGDRYDYVIAVDKNMDWDRRPSKILDKNFILGKDLVLPPNLRIYYETYIKRILMDIKCFINDGNIMESLWKKYFDTPVPR